MNLTRRELKFQIPLSLVEPISRYVSAYCEMDKYSRIAHDGFYTINSLYLDNDRMTLLENKRANLPRRFSMRLRSYGEQPTFPLFLEIKAKADNYINKQRAPVTSAATVDFLRDGRGVEDNLDLDHPAMVLGVGHIRRMGLKPKLMTQYRRKAYFGRFDPYSRVTFDRQLRCYKENQYSVFPDARNFVSYDHEEKFNKVGSNVVLELKCESKVPFWMMALVRHFELSQSQFSKYDSSWSHLNDDIDLNFGFMSTSCL